jgi:hypothetical protein
MTRLDLRASVTHRGGHFLLTLRAARGDLKGFLPGRFIVDGTLADGTLTFMSDPKGCRKVTYTGNSQYLLYDYVQLTVDYLGFQPAEALIPQDVGASAETGIITIDYVPADHWVPRRYQGDPRLQRVAELLTSKSPSDIAKMLTRRDRTDYDDVLAGKISPLDVPPHVALLARAARA